MPCFLCRKWDGFVTGAEGQKVTWVKPQDLKNYPMPPADEPLLAMIRDFI
jgi:8-oxo-dGTP diphosphatase